MKVKEKCPFCGKEYERELGDGETAGWLPEKCSRCRRELPIPVSFHD